MSTSIDRILRIYNVRPKKQRKGRKGNKAPEREREVKRMHSVERTKDFSPVGKVRMHSLEPSIGKRSSDQHAFSFTSLPVSVDTSLEESFERLEKLMDRSNKARASRRTLQVQMLQLGVSELMTTGKLESIAELDDLHVDEMFNIGLPTVQVPDALLSKYEAQRLAQSKPS